MYNKEIRKIANG